MKRRTFVAAVGTGALAGCSTISEGGGTPTRTPVSSVRVGSMEVSISQLFAKEYLRYYDSEADEVRKLKPERDWWVETSVSVSNLEDGTIYGPVPGAFTFVMGGERIAASGSLPGAEWSQVRLRDRHKAFWVEPGYFGGNSEATAESDALLYLLGDVPKDTSPRIEWDDGSEVWSFKPANLLLPPGATGQ